MNPERRPLIRPRARRVHRTAVHVDDVAHDREPQAEATGASRDAGIALPKAFEDVWQELWLDADPGVRHDDSREPIDALEA